MKTWPAIFRASFLLLASVLAWVAADVPLAGAAPILWNGANTNFTQTGVPAGSPPAADILIKGAVSLARNGNHWLYNTNVDLTGAGGGTPTDTEWAFVTGPINSVNDATGLSYESFDSLRTGDLSGVLLGIPAHPGSVHLVMHLIAEDIYIPVSFTAWPHGGGFFGYTRATAPAVAPPAPSITITNPAANAVFAVPANVTIGANATVTGGTITNVIFFGNNISLGSRQSTPFTFTANNLSAGDYAFKAVATAGGISATSAVVNISVVSPVLSSLMPAVAANDQFSFSYGANAGLRYVIESSSNLFNWMPVMTNLANGSQGFFTTNILPGDSFYRVGRLPNPQ
jgi:hypothetical protein